MNDDSDELSRFDGMTRLFPLPGLVAYPHVVQGLHIFEARYRAMMEATIDDNFLMSLVLLTPGWNDENYDDNPPIEMVACLGKVDYHERLPDGRYNLQFRGLARVRIREEVELGEPFRTARADLLPDVVLGDMTKLLSIRKELANAVLPRFETNSTAYQQLAMLFKSDTPLGELCDMLSFALPLDLSLKQQLLAEPHVHRRAELLIYALKRPETSRGRDFPPAFSDN